MLVVRVRGLRDIDTYSSCKVALVPYPRGIAFLPHLKRVSRETHIFNTMVFSTRV